MKRITYILLFSILLVSCSTRSGYSKMKGRFLHMNQNELYVYSPDDGIVGLDTIKAGVGRFSYEKPCSEPSTLIIIFPNYSIRPVFAESGEVVEVKTDASRLKGMEVEGTENNELMTKFRKQIASVSPPEESKYAIALIKDCPESAASVYLLNRYFVQTESPDYKQAVGLLPLLIKEQPDNVTLGHLQRRLSELGSLPIGSRLPKFSAKNISGKTINNASLQGKDIVIINVWVTWSYENLDAQRALNDAVKVGKIAALGICVDANLREAKQTLEHDGIEFSNICDGGLLNTSLFKAFGLNAIPDSIIIRNGKVIERDITVNTIRQCCDAK